MLTANGAAITVCLRLILVASALSKIASSKVMCRGGLMHSSVWKIHNKRLQFTKSLGCCPQMSYCWLWVSSRTTRKDKLRNQRRLKAPLCISTISLLIRQIHGISQNQTKIQLNFYFRPSGGSSKILTAYFIKRQNRCSLLHCSHQGKSARILVTKIRKRRQILKRRATLRLSTARLISNARSQRVESGCHCHKTTRLWNRRC